LVFRTLTAPALATILTGNGRRHLALGELKIFIAALLTMVTLEVAPDSTFPGMSMDRIGFGVVHARGDVHVALRRRS
jgi:hypothetical protein